MLHFHDTLCQGNETQVWHACGFRKEFQADAGYCRDALEFVPAGSTQRFETALFDPVCAFAAPRFAYRF
ncbi:hypothetical protein BcepIL02_gp34 [Burkholderia phage BcepIL02]|uniref:Uncharacterized protein n=1 Tax=Burkholderia phage BcepIL02 TaxID=2886898 RepID=C5IHM6_9CAUD|nr:hypothetical protein BcepIL02_gp34 [Burkholderia phage BcepIL02]ACR15027.1 hypothetical protein BcepIL02_gp34 [Burkholderia phage BcepIL02]